jgi:hypothetical protein
MRRHRILASTFLALTLTAAGASAQYRAQSRYQRPASLDREQYFRMLDRNHDGWISQREYDGDYPFNLADRDRNGYLSWAEWRDSRAGGRYRYNDNSDQYRYNSDQYRYNSDQYRYNSDQYRYDNDRYRYNGDIDSAQLREFLRLDRNGDEFLTRSEWPGDYRTFERLDRNGDGAIHIREYLEQ